jgi:hydrogenase nickel incorporation protein HypA/HybF
MLKVLLEGQAMHESAVAAQLLRKIEWSARAEGMSRVTAIRVRVGAFAGVDPARLRSAFRLLTLGTMAEGARIQIEPVPIEAECTACGFQFRIESFRFACPACACGESRVVSGEEMILDEVTVVIGTDDARDQKPSIESEDLGRGA